MASFQKRLGKWRAQVARNGVRQSATFLTKAQAEAWANKIEGGILDGKAGIIPRWPFRDLLDKYAKEVSPRKDGARWEVLRLALIGRDQLGDVRLPDLSKADFAAWRDRRKLQVSEGSVLREWKLLRNVITVAMQEWGLLKENPMAGVRRPVEPPPRDRLATCEELERIFYCLGWDGDIPGTVTARVAVAALFAVETGMRAGEIAGLTHVLVNTEARYCRLLHTKNGRPRDVPLSPGALWLLEQLPPMEPVFGLTARQIDVLWRRGRDRAAVENLTFHDLRHLAITRLSKRLGVLELARMVGHSDIRQLMVYYNESASETAGKL